MEDLREPARLFRREGDQEVEVGEPLQRDLRCLRHG